MRGFGLTQLAPMALLSWPDLVPGGRDINSGSKLGAIRTNAGAPSTHAVGQIWPNFGKVWPCFR